MASAQNDPAGIFPAEISAHMTRGMGGIEGTVTGGAGLGAPPRLRLPRLAVRGILCDQDRQLYDDLRQDSALADGRHERNLALRCQPSPNYPHGWRESICEL